MNTQSGREAEWLAGWVSIFHLKKAEQSLKHFKKVWENSDDQNVKSKAAFWLARAFQKQIIVMKRKKWIVESAKNKFSFYGQNASIKIDQLKINRSKK